MSYKIYKPISYDLIYSVDTVLRAWDNDILRICGAFIFKNNKFHCIMGSLVETKRCHYYDNINKKQGMIALNSIEHYQEQPLYSLYSIAGISEILKWSPKKELENIKYFEKI